MDGVLRGLTGYPKPRFVRLAYDNGLRRMCVHVHHHIIVHEQLWRQRVDGDVDGIGALPTTRFGSDGERVPSGRVHYDAVERLSRAPEVGQIRGVVTQGGIEREGGRCISVQRGGMAASGGIGAEDALVAYGDIPVQDIAIAGAACSSEHIVRCALRIIAPGDEGILQCRTAQVGIVPVFGIGAIRGRCRGCLQRATGLRIETGA